MQKTTKRSTPLTVWENYKKIFSSVYVHVEQTNGWLFITDDCVFSVNKQIMYYKETLYVSIENSKITDTAKLDGHWINTSIIIVLDM